MSHGHPQESKRNACFWLCTHIHLRSLPHQPSRRVPKIFPTGLVVPLLLLLHLCLLPAASAPIPLPSQPPGPAHPAASPRRSCIPSQPASGGRRSCCRAASRSCGALTAWRGRRYRGAVPIPIPSWHSPDLLVPSPQLRPVSVPWQDAAVCIGRHQELMRRVLSDPQLVRLQREGGAVLARLRREAARLSTSPHVR